MSMKQPGLQEAYLNAMRKEKIPATFFLVNGFQMKGIVQAFDSFTIIIESGKDQDMIFKHAISTIIPVTPLRLSDLAVAEE
ncbi:MAG: RNA chaperone Hfq [Clostridia bacterium]|nr:RNA chaperone Hfq [Clostridia bacterium]